ncbi:glycosyltransferase family 4 protein [Patescibacteria group bacterium]|nr:glycosyltransferase family 4 protein [Patescibacteria group bacterium]
MKIALVGYEANIKNRVGSNQYAFELIKAIYQLDKKNQYTVFLPSSSLPDLPKERKNWQYQVVSPRKLWNIFGLPRALYQQKPDIVFNPGHYSPLFSPAPLIVSIMDLGYLRFPEQFTKPIYWKLKLWTGLSIKRARHIFAISESTKNDIIEYYRVSPDKITVTYPGYDRDKFNIRVKEREGEKVKRKYKIKGDYILFLGTLKPNKNIEGLLEAFKLVASDQWLVIRKKKPVTSHRSPITLVIAGRKGWLFQSIFEKVKELSLEDKVIFTDFVPEDDVSVLMKGAKVFVLPSFWEGFGIPVVEAMACGTPVVVSNAGSLPEIVGEGGVIVNPYNPEEIARGIKKAIDNKDDLIKKGLKQAQKFSWQECAKKTIKVLERM